MDKGVVRGLKMAKAYYTVPSDGLYEERKKFFEKQLETTVFAYGLVYENPFFIETFPTMRDISYSIWTKRGTLYVWRGGDDERYREKLGKYMKERYGIDPEAKKINTRASITLPSVYNIVTGEPIKPVIRDFLNGDPELVIKKVDMGLIYAKHMYGNRSQGNLKLGEIYNEIRVGFFLNELRYAYREVVTHHFMTVVDWFVSDTNLYPKDKGSGPFQYIVSEKLDMSLREYLIAHPTMETLRCTLFSVAHALEVAWHTNEFIHYDLHDGNVMLKKAPLGGKDYLYTRPDIDATYLLPSSGTHDMIVKILDFGRCRMKIPVMSCCGDKRNLFDHIRPVAIHDEHKGEIFYMRENEFYGDDVDLKPDRTWDVRRLLFDLLTRLPPSYWGNVKKSDETGFAILITKMEAFLPLQYTPKEKGSDGPFPGDGPLLQKILFSELRGLYLALKEADIIVEKEKGPISIKEEGFGQYLGVYGFKALPIDTLKVYGAWKKKNFDKITVTVLESKETPTTFLSSAFFKSFKQESIKYDETKHVWMGRTPK